jgi:hypothetical protein
MYKSQFEKFCQDTALLNKGYCAFKMYPSDGIIWKLVLAVLVGIVAGGRDGYDEVASFGAFFAEGECCLV